ncbi:MAG: hypothetical protein OEV60_02625 [Actinomycetota bacterium]|nr:hypothetical protein [Actinomycetota bacterium]MDH5224430.1 hypothetical protein [Actinomycetota bacterium]MDH5312607.1 hypothetical protein [Actinomycetota bacterium]
MRDLDAKLRAAHAISGPDLWDRIDRRANEYLSSAPTRYPIDDRPRAGSLPRWPTDRLIAAVVAIAIALTSTVVLVRVLHFEPRSAQPAEARASITTQIEVASIPLSMAFAENAVWVVSAEDSLLQRIDPDTNEVVAEIRVFGPNRRPNEIRSTPGAIWVTSEEGGVTRVDAATNEVSGRWPIHGDFVDWTRGSIWISSPDRGQVIRIDALSDEIVARIPVPHRPTGLLATDWAVWVVNDDPASDRETLTQIDPRTNEVQQIVRVGGELAEEIVWSPDGTIWVAGCIDDRHACAWTPLGIDATSGEIVHRRPVTIPGNTEDWHSPFDVHTAGDGRLWGAVADYYEGPSASSGTLLEIDPRNGEVISATDVGTFITDLAYGSGSVWAAEGTADQILRIQPGS